MDDTKLQEDLLKQIDAHLPKLIAGQLKTRIESVEKLEKEIDELQVNAKGYIKELCELRSLNLAEKFIGERTIILDKKEKELDEKQTKLELEKAKVELATEKRIADRMIEFLQNLTKAPIVRREFQKAIVQPDSQWQNTQIVNESEHIIEE